MVTGAAIRPSKEIGSFYARLESSPRNGGVCDSFSYLGDTQWLATGRMVIQALCCRPAHEPRRIHVPDYFCPDVVQALRRTCDVKVYVDSPLLRHPEWKSLRASAGDLILAVDYFGLRPLDVWGDWRRSHPSVLLVQDLTHNPMPERKVLRDTDYAFASVRKSLPVFDGAWVMSPKGHPLPVADGPLPESLYDRFVCASRLKHAYISGESRDKQTFLTMFREAEHDLDEQYFRGISAGSAKDISQLDVSELLARRHGNARSMIEDLRTRPPQTFSVLPPRSSHPWNPVLSFPNRACRDFVHSGLIDQGIFASVHWSIEKNDLPSGHRAAFETAGRLLTLPIDHRCTQADLVRIRTVLDELDTHHA